MCSGRDGITTNWSIQQLVTMVSVDGGCLGNIAKQVVTLIS